MFNRRKFIYASAFGSAAVVLGKKIFPVAQTDVLKGNPVVISTWDAGLDANKAAWQILSKGGRALDAVEEGVKVTESSDRKSVV